MGTILNHPIIARKIARFLLIMHHKIYLMLGKFICAAEGGLHPKHRLMNYHKFFVDNVNEGDTILDLGCGNGALSFDLAGKARFVKGIDKCRRNITLCKQKFARENIEYIVADIIDYLPKERFDVVILSNILEHIEKRQEFLRKLGSITDKLLLRVPLINRDWVTLYKKELGLSYMLDSTHKIEYNTESFKDEIREAGFEIADYSIQFGEIWAIGVKASLWSKKTNRV